MRLDLLNRPDLITVVVKNDGPQATFRAEVLKVTSPQWKADAEPRAPWAIRWADASTAENEIGPAASKVLQLVQYDHAGAQSQVQSQGGAAFRFLAPKDRVVKVRGAFGLGSLDDLKKVNLEVTLRVLRKVTDDDSPWVERTLCFSYTSKAVWCDKNEASG
jgi:hypothetical protein